MIAYNADTIFATPNEWGLVQNSLRQQSHVYTSHSGWRTTFVVNATQYEGLGWHLLREENVMAIAISRKALPATSFCRLD